MKIGDKVLFIESYNGGVRYIGQVGVLTKIHAYNLYQNKNYIHTVKFNDYCIFTGNAIPLTPLNKALL